MRDKDKKEINIFTRERIRFYRENAGYSREGFAELVGVSSRFTADLETGSADVSLTSLKEYAKFWVYLPTGCFGSKKTVWVWTSV